MLSKERKIQMIESLKQDYVVLTDIMVEVVADTKADMFCLQLENRATAELAEDKKRLLQLDEEYMAYYKTSPEKAIDCLEKIYELSDKYDKLRMAH